MASLNLMPLESDYSRIEICSSNNYRMSESLLESDYSRIEIVQQIEYTLFRSRLRIRL